MSNSDSSSGTTVDPTWIKIKSDGKFICSECENEVEPLTNTVDGLIKADLEKIKSELEEFSTKVIYGVCPVCGMEYIFRLVGGDLYLEPSDEEK